MNKDGVKCGITELNINMRPYSVFYTLQSHFLFIIVYRGG